MPVVHQPQGSGVAPVKNGTALVQAPKGATSGSYTDPNYRIDTRVSNLPTTGMINDKYDGRFDDTSYYTA